MIKANDEPRSSPLQMGTRSLKMTYTVPPEERIKIRPGQPVRFTRSASDGVTRIVFVGLIGEIVDRGNTLEITTYEPEKLVIDRGPAPFAPPMNERVTSPHVFDFWWKQFDYVFGLPDPRQFPPLPTAPDGHGLELVRRYAKVAGDLAGSSFLNALREGFNVRMPNGVHGETEIEQEFSAADVQAGFAALLRHCDSAKEPAHFEAVRGVLWLAAQAASDERRAARLDHLAAWSRAAKDLHKKSLNQLLRDKLVTEGHSAFDFQEEHTPQQLLSFYNYGDLLHWSAKRDVIAEFEEDEYTASDRRLAYLESAGALGHLYVGFGELARRAIGEAPKE